MKYKGTTNIPWKQQDDIRREPIACNCIGPQNGEPVCPCRMKNVVIVDGRYKEIIDLGEVVDDVC